ncbi:MAG: HupE/UreJ family protein [Myxococcota bacterium]
MLLTLVPARAAAHDADILYVRAERASGSGEVRQLATLTAATLALLAPVDADADGQLTQADLDARKEAIAAGVWAFMPLEAGGQRCTQQGHQALLRETFVELAATFSCAPGELRQTFRVLSVLPSNYKVVLGSQIDGERGQAFAQGHRQTLLMGEEAPATRGLTGWIQLGVFHIFTGIDHLAFLLALLLVGGTWRRMLWMVTAFTAAHSLTLGLAGLELVQFSARAERWVEAAIALSIIWVAAENLLLRQHRHRAALTFAFGLVHGFGFASVLQSYGLKDEVVTGLFGFNLGVELGQAVVVGALFPAVKLLQRRGTVGTWAMRTCSGLIIVAGAVWLVQRV